MNFDVAIVGGSAAGLSTALVLGRCGRSVVVIDSGDYRNAVTRHAHNFLTRDGIDPEEFRALGRRDLAPYGTTILEDRVDSIEDHTLYLKNHAPIEARRIVLATGMRDNVPSIDGFDSIYGISAHHCPFCDAWEWRQKRWIVITNHADYVLSLLNWTPHLTVCRTHNKPHARGIRTLAERYSLAVEHSPIVSVRENHGMLHEAVLEDGRSIPAEALFFHLGATQNSTLPRDLNLKMTPKGFVKANARHHTSMRHVYAAGDLTPGPQSLITASAEGMKVAMAVHQCLRNEDIGSV